MGVRVREKIQGSGKWWVFVSHKRKRISRQVGTKKAAEKVRDNIQARIKLGQDALPEDKLATPTLETYWSGFEETYLPGAVRDNTIDSYRRNFKNHVLPELGNLSLDELTRDKVKAFVGHLLQKRTVRTVKERVIDNNGRKVVRRKTVEHQLARSSIRIILAELGNVLNHAVEDRIIEVNPAARLGKYYKQAHVRREEVEPLTFQEVPRFLQSVLDRCAEYYPLFLCAIHTGLRAGEIAGLQWADVDFSGKFLTVRRGFTKGKMQSTKTNRIRRVDVSDALLETLEELKRHRKVEALKKGTNEIPSFVFCNQEGNPPDMDNIKNRQLTKCLEKAKLRRIRFHDLRHTFASLLIQNGESLAYVKDQLGHSSIKMTVDVYGHLVPGANRAAVNRLPALDSVSPKSIAALSE